MSFKDIFNPKTRKKYITLPPPSEASSTQISGAEICPQCGSHNSENLLQNSLKVCPGCGYHYPLTAQERIWMIADNNSFSELDDRLMPADPLSFPGYADKLAKVREETGLKEAIITGKAEINGEKVIVGVMDRRFLMGSMGSVVGEKIARVFETACAEKAAVVLFTASGGARMQEGMLSLMQMAKTSAAVARFHQKGLLYISVLTDPTTGGVTASFATLADIIIAEPGALVCFTGPRVIEQTIHHKIPEGFQRAEFLLEHGMIDQIVHRKDLKQYLSKMIALHRWSDKQ